MRDSLGNIYSSAPSGQKKGAKPSKGGKRKIGRSKRKGDWVATVKMRERVARSRGHRFPVYPC